MNGWEFKVNLFVEVLAYNTEYKLGMIWVVKFLFLFISLRNICVETVFFLWERACLCKEGLGTQCLFFYNLSMNLFSTHLVGKLDHKKTNEKLVFKKSNGTTTIFYDVYYTKLKLNRQLGYLTWCCIKNIATRL